MCDDCQEHNHGEHEHHHHTGFVHRAQPDEFRVVITGKGGVGKTSLTALMARLLARDAFRVLALDADPQMNLPYALGMSRAVADNLVPLSQNPDYVEEKTGARPGQGWGPFFRLNPDVADVVDRFGVIAPDQVRLLIMGNTVQPAAGCLCPENTLLAAVANAVSLRRGEVILMDTQAGIEHFGRALAQGFRHAVVVTDPTFNGVQVALQAGRLAEGLGIPAIHLVINRVRGVRDMDRVNELLAAEPTLPFTTRHWLPWEDRLLESEPDVGPLLSQVNSPFMAAVRSLRDTLLEVEAEKWRAVS